MASNASNNKMAISANNAKMIISANNTKMKGLLKGLRYISQIFDDNNKDQEMQIGFPTDVKHVAHIGWDGPSIAAASAPSWMNEFEGSQGHSAPLGNGDNKDDSGVKWASEDSSRAGSRGIGLRSPGHDDMPDVPKASRRHSSTSHGSGGAYSPKREKSDKPKQTRRSSKTRDSSDSCTEGVRQPMDPIQGRELLQNLPDIPKKTRRKKSKDGASVGGLSRKSKGQASSETCASPGHHSASILKCSSNDLSPKNSFQEGEGKGFT